jgi:hypothetical protein
MGTGTTASNGLDRSKERDDEPAVRDLPDPDRQELTEEDIEVLIKAGLTEIARVGRRYVVT